MTAPTTVVFDIGGVLIDADYRVLCRKFLDDDTEVEHFLTEVLGADFHHERDRGVPMAQSTADWSERHPEYAEAIQTFCTRFPENWIGPVPGSVEILEELKAARIAVYGLTNWGRETWPLARERFAFLDLLDGVLVSSHVGLTKPDPAIFTTFCSTFAVAAEECWFVDDVERNVVAARGVGFRGSHFTSATKFRRDLVDAGLLPARLV
jgi:2-haloacid dehalogenase